MAKTYHHYVIEFPDGSTYEIKKSVRNYTHAVIAFYIPENGWMCAGTHGNERNAAKRETYYHNCPARADFRDIQIVPVIEL